LKVLRFEQKRALVLVVRIQPFQVEAPIGTVSRRHRPGPPVAGERLVEPAVGALAGPPPRYASRWAAPSARAAGCRTPAPVTAGRTPATLRTHPAIVPDAHVAVIRSRRVWPGIQAGGLPRACTPGSFGQKF